ncbi:MAG: helicase-related protein [Desulfurococcaceae archaeon]
MFKYYVWQLEAFEAWRQRRYGVIVAPTGSGKTAVALLALQSSEYRPCLVVAPTNALIEQHAKTFMNAGLQVGVWNCQSKSLGHDVTITTYNSAYNCADTLLSYAHLVVFDEAHHLWADKWSVILVMLRVPWMGLTATPEGIDEEYIVYRYDMRRAVEEGVISGVEVHHVLVDVPMGVKLVIRDIEERIQSLRKLLATTEDEAERDAILSKIAVLYNRIRMLLDSLASKYEAVASIIQGHSISRALVFVEGIEMCNALVKYLRGIGINAMPYHSKLPSHVRREVMHVFRSAGAVLVAVRALDEGIDVPSVKHIFILSVPKRLRRAVQRIGRGLRAGEKLQLYVVESSFGEASSAWRAAELR